MLRSLSLPMLCRFVLFVFVLAGFVRAEEPTRDIKTAAAFIDADIDRHLRDAKLTAAPLTSDEEFLRRAFLDITGRIPTAKQAAEFLDNNAPNKRVQLIEALLASPNFGEQFGRVWRDWIAPAELPSEGNGGDQPIQATQNLGKWFAGRFNQGDGWDKIVRAILTADGTLKEQPQGLFFSLVGDDQGRPRPAGTARAIGSLFMGVQMQCAECHNDPFKDWKQSDFWGTAAFFRNVNWKFNGRFFDSVTESPEGVDKAGKKIPLARDPAPVGAIAIPKDAFKNVGKIIPAKFVGGQEFAAEEKQILRPVFTDWLTGRENPYFARAFVNRTWWYFFARGIVHPVDDYREDNLPSHPALLKRLTDEFVASDFDVRHLVRCITNTAAYQRTSRPAKDNNEETVAAFGRMPVRLMSADVLYDSLRLAMSDPGLDLRSYDAAAAARFGESSPVGTPHLEFVRLFGINEDDATDFTHGIPQILALMNHPRLRGGGKTVDEVIKAKQSPEDAVVALYLGALSRRPTNVELEEAKQYLAAGRDLRRAYNGLLWTLINRSEFLLAR